jgi:hypothetical protein
MHRPPSGASGTPERSDSRVQLPLLIGFMLITTSIFRLYLIRSGKVAFVFGFQRYFPWLFLAAGVFMVGTTLLGI